MDHFVKLDALPDGVRLPADMKDRLWFEPENHRLVHRGFMSKSDFDRLSQLSDDWSYRRQMEELFRLSGPDEPRKKGLRGLLSGMMGFGF